MKLTDSLLRRVLERISRQPKSIVPWVSTIMVDEAKAISLINDLAERGLILLPTFAFGGTRHCYGLTDAGRAELKRLSARRQIDPCDALMAG